MPDHWHETTLGEVGEVNPKEAPLAEDAPFVPMDAVNVGQRWVEYTEPRGTRSGARARAGDVLFARITPCLENGKTAQVQREIDRCGGSTEFIVLRGTERLDPDFLYFWATDRNVRERAANLMTGSTGRQRLSPRDLAAMTLSVPPISEQRRIVNLVGSIDTYIDSLETQIETTRTARSALLSELLSNPGDDWQETTLGEVANWTSGGTPKASEAKFYGGDIPWCVIGDLNEGYVVQTEKHLTAEGLAGSSAKLLPAGAVLIAMYGASIGRTGITGVPMATNQAIASASVDESKVRGLFLLCFLQSRKEHFVARGAGAAQPNISQTLIRSWAIHLPPLVEQQRIVDLVASFDEQVSSLESQVESVRALRSGVLSELLSGERLLDESYDVAVGL